MILLTGARGVVGAPLIEALRKKELYCISVSRQGLPHTQSEVSLTWDLNADIPNELRTQDSLHTLIHTAPIWLLPNHLDSLFEIGIKRLVVFSSTSVISKKLSASHHELELVKSLEDAETCIMKSCQTRNIELWILRPTMIYGYGRDQNISHIASMIRRFGFALLAGAGRGLRQPIHADDLVQVCLQILDRPFSHTQKVFNLAGGEVLSYREMVSRVFQGLGKTPRILSIPTVILRLILALASKVRVFDYTPDMANRMNQDLVYDCSEILREIDYAPQKFLEQPKRDLV